MPTAKKGGESDDTSIVEHSTKQIVRTAGVGIEANNWKRREGLCAMDGSEDIIGGIGRRQCAPQSIASWHRDVIGGDGMSQSGDSTAATITTRKKKEKRKKTKGGDEQRLGL